MLSPSSIFEQITMEDGQLILGAQFDLLSAFVKSTTPCIGLGWENYLSYSTICDTMLIPTR